MYTILRRVEGSELDEVATAEDREAAEKLVRSLKKLWPDNTYEVRESEPIENVQKQANG